MVSYNSSIHSAAVIILQIIDFNLFDTFLELTCKYIDHCGSLLHCQQKPKLNIFLLCQIVIKNF